MQTSLHSLIFHFADVLNCYKIFYEGSKIMKRIQKILAGIFLLAVLLLGLMPVSTKAAALKATDPCYKITPQLTSASWKYIDEIYRQKYPNLGITNWFLSDADGEVLQKLSDTITKGLTSPSSKATAIARWIKGNITYDTTVSSFPVDVFYSRRGDCQGYAMLMTALLRFADIPAVECIGWRGDMKNHFMLGKHGSEIGHAWVMVWLGDDWYLFDPLFEVYKCKDQSFIAKWYFFDLIDGVCPYYDGIPFQYINNGEGVFYKDGRFLYLINGIPGSQVYNSSVQPYLSAEDISYPAVLRYKEPNGFSHDGWEYDENPERKDQMINDECYSNGWLGDEYAKPNGIIATNSIVTKNGMTLFLSYAGAAFYLPGKSSDYTLTKGAITLRKGQSLSGFYPYSYRKKEEGYVLTWKSEDPSIATVTPGGKVTGISEGYVNLSYDFCRLEDNAYIGGGFIQFYVSASDRKADYTDHSQLDKHAKIILYDKRCRFTGSEIRPAVTVTCDGNTLSEDSDYTLSYKNNINPGTGTIIVTGKGVYKGTLKTTFLITSADGTPVPETPSTNTRPKKGQTLTHASGSKYLVTGTRTVAFKAPKKGAKAVVIPKTVTLKGYPFKVTSIASAAFRNNATVTKVTVGSNVTTIGQKAFSNCSKLSSITLGSSVKNIGAYAFYRCTALKKLTIPAATTSIGKSAFYGCKKLTFLTIRTARLTSKTIGTKAFIGTPKKLTVSVPKKQKTAYTRLLRSKGISRRAIIK